MPAQGVKVLDLLMALDKLACTWYDQWFLGQISEADLDQKHIYWKKRFRRASQQINNLCQSCGLKPKSHVAQTALTAKNRLQVGR